MSDVRAWRVEVEGFPPYLKYGATRSMVRYDVARDINEAWGCGFKTAFKNINRVILATEHEIETVEADNTIISTERQLR